MVPHFTQREFEQEVLASVQTLPAQQGPPALPHRAQIPSYEEYVSQTADEFLHAVVLVMELQQDCPRSPQLWQT